MAKKELATLFVTIGLDDKDLQKGLNSAQKHIKEWSKGMAIAGAAITAALGFATKAALDEEVGINRLRGALKNAGEDYNSLSAEIEKSIEATQKKTNYGDEAQREALVELIGITGTYKGALQQLQLATDLAAAKDMDLVSAATLVGRAATGNTQLLSRYGIEVREGASDMEVLADMQKRFAGSAEAAADPLKQLGNEIGDMVQEIGSMLLPSLRWVVDHIKTVVQWVRSWIEEHPALAQALTIAAGALGIFLGLAGTLGMALPTIARGLTMLIKLFHLQAAASKVAAAATWLWNAALSAAPIVLVAAAIGGLVYWLTSLFHSTSENTADMERYTRALEENEAQIKKVTDETAKLKTEKEGLSGLLEKVKGEYDAIKASSGGYADEVGRLKNDLLNTNLELDRQKDTLEEVQASFDAASKKVKGFEDAIDAANRELQALSNPRLEGMQEFEDQLFNIDTQLKQLQLLKLTRGGDTTAIDAQIEALEKQREILELQRDIKFDSLLHQAQESVETIQGLNEEMAPQAVIDRIAELGNILSPDGELMTGYTAAKDELAAQTELLNAQKDIVNELTKAAEGYRDRLSEIEVIVANTLQDKQNLLDLIQKTITNIDDAIAKTQEQMAELQTQAADIQEKLEIAKKFRDYAETLVKFRKAFEYEGKYYHLVEDEGGQRWEPIEMPVMDTGGLVQGPGVFSVGPGVREIVRYGPGVKGGDITNNFNISQLVVREQADIQRIARELYKMQQVNV